MVGDDDDDTTGDDDDTTGDDDDTTGDDDDTTGDDDEDDTTGDDDDDDTTGDDDDDDTTLVDADGDGSPEGEDCDDSDAERYPGAIELCDAVDQDCDGDPANGLTFDSWYADLDLDGFGDATDSVSTCDGAPAGYVADASDCDDAHDGVRPDAVEQCDAIDSARPSRAPAPGAEQHSGERGDVALLHLGLHRFVRLRAHVVFEGRHPRRPLGGNTMFGFAFGTMCAVGLIALSRRRWHHPHARDHGYRRASCGGGGPRARRRGGKRRAPPAAVMGEMLKRRLDADEDQALVIDHAVADIRAAMGEWFEALRDARSDAADTLRGDSVDDAALEALFTRTDDDLARTRRHLVSAIKQVHAVLDDEQREDLADLVNGWSTGGRW